MIKICVAGFSFFFSGVNDGSLGALTPYIIRKYHVGTEYVAIIYASSFAGWLLAASTNSHLSRYLDLGALLTVGTVLQLIGQLLRFWSPPFGLFVVTFFCQATGMGIQDAHSNTFVTSIKGAHRWLGFIHAMYALGCLVAPFVATAIASRIPQQWHLFYTFLVGIGTINAIAVLIAFRDSLKIHKQLAAEDNTSRSKNATKDIKDTLKNPSVYLLSMFYFFMLGTVITAGGWIVEYLISARNGKLPEVGYVPAGLWVGTFLGRVLLSEPTYRYGERRMALGYCVLMLALQLIFWLVPNLISSAITISFFGFFSGPLFATGMSIASKLFPKHIQPTALGFLFVLAQAGGSLFPALTGVIASRAGVKVLQPMLVGLIVAMGISWVLVPKVPKRAE
ncbi:MFS general substrate transporter [Aaosphaeria arxii CBS 175.79]|uniref:MFS general substrate transporter n=1 Tax=Aaosphaeria arxii CBS 175.79 TaxID=1450172 RepID=A0A6A5Y4W2_9PLEO|nr:MFS general substrate transporter [Aaosphaeria arxii CBS 175.79]KAF2020296.1 MFS general substrate transporter [Aaosphaeria arxii CBS 175.79]